MIIWKGLGILVPVIAIAGAIIGTVAGTVLGFPEWGMGLGLGMAAVGNGLLWRSINFKSGRVMMDPQTGQKFVLKANHSLFFIPAGFWSIPMALLGLLALLVIPGSKERDARNAATPGYKEFEAANSLIASHSKGAFHGNTDEAREAARSFSSSMKTMASLAFTGGSKKNLMTDGEFLTYCQDGEDGIVILCHVPSLRSYKTEETKSALAQIAWSAGQACAAKLDTEQKKSLVVGLRGIASYGSIQQGPTSGDAKPKSLPTSDRSVFYSFFAPPPAPEPEAVVPAPVAPSPVAPEP